MTLPSFIASKSAGPKLKTAKQWYGALNWATAGTFTKRVAVDNARRAMDFFAIYAETNDQRYLGLSDDFLKDAIGR